MNRNPSTYWKSIFGIERFKVEYKLKQFMYEWFGITLPKLQDQKEYWLKRGTVYRDEILASGYLDREVFFQDMIMDLMGKVKFKSCFEAGCGFGWNILRCKQEFPDAFVGGVDFSMTQLMASRNYMNRRDIPVVKGDNCKLPFRDGAFDIGFSLGVYMNIHPNNIKRAARELLRVCNKRIIHVEYDETRTTEELRRKRAFKTNIVSHDFKAIYESLGAKVTQVLTHKDFGAGYQAHRKNFSTNLDRWEGFEGPEKYTVTVINCGENA